MIAQLCSLAGQSRQNFNILVFQDGDNGTIESVVESFPKLYPEVKIEFKYISNRDDDYRHSLREIALQDTKASFLLLTNDDNYHVPKFLRELMPPLESRDYRVSYSNLMHSQFGYQPFET